MDIWRALHNYKQQKGSRRRLSSWFSSEAMVKGYQAYRDSWATVLSKKMPCLREVGNRVNLSLTWRLGREAWHSKVWSIAVSCLRKNKNRKNSCKANTAFLWNFAPVKISHCGKPLRGNKNKRNPCWLTNSSLLPLGCPLTPESLCPLASHLLQFCCIVQPLRHHQLLLRPFQGIQHLRGPGRTWLSLPVCPHMHCNSGACGPPYKEQPLGTCCVSSLLFLYLCTSCKTFI